ncbi:MAG TPA: excisionase family DNA-binding protein [Candidatus Acidoferrales bacterium]|jgi:excisionase family DNA binding protein|nr:excisionase family DNA-binding protein [Candidatus Acidoferrales bacterium]
MESGDYSLQEACKVARVSRGTLRQWLETRKLKFYRTPGGHIRIPREALDAVRGNEQGSGPHDAPSSVLRNRRERVEELALETQELRAQRDLDKLRTEQAEEAERRAAEARAKERERQEQLEQARAERIRQEHDREEKEAKRAVADWRRSWIVRVETQIPRDFPSEMRQSAKKAAKEIIDRYDGPEDDQVIDSEIQQILAALMRELQCQQEQQRLCAQAVEDAIGRIPWGLSFAERDAIADEIRAKAEALLQGATVAAVKAAIQPILDRASSNCAIKRVLPQIHAHLRDLARRDWIDDRDVDFWKRRLEPRVRAKLEEEGQKRKLTEEEAVALLRSFVEAELSL